ncbi:MAG TPA: hypothetical protein VGN14_00580 [Candidatus Elarobacter sp.]|jgi:hypothetical protein
MKEKPYRTTRTTRRWNAFVKGFVWVFLVIFVLTSVGLTLVVVSSAR